MNIKVQGGQVLSGEITPSGSKNSAVALLPASLLFNKPITFQNVPEITDVDRLVNILTKLGSKINWDKEAKSMQIDNSNVDLSVLTKEDIGNMKGTSLLWGPMLARFGKLDFEELPGGCTLGVRPLDPHYEAFRKMGVTVDENDTSVKMNASNAKAQEFWLTEMSPTVTENVIMLAAKLSGTTKVIGAASEPQVQDLCQFLISAGVKISGVGSSILEIRGVEEIQPVEHEILSDHYEIATFLALGALTGGKITVHKALPEHFAHIMHVFNQFGIDIKYDGDSATVESGTKIKIKPGTTGNLTIKAQPWPGLPVDLLPIFIPLGLCAEKGQVLYHNWMYEAGLFWTSELTKFGANIVMADPHRVVVTGGSNLYGAKIEAPYIIRAVVALTMTAMIAEGESTILNADALYRGHPHFEENLKKLGAKIEVIK